MRLLIFHLLFPTLCLSQQAIDATQFFARGLSTDSLPEKSAKEEINFPWIDEYEFRTETRDFDLGKQEYTVRLSPSTGRIRKAQRAFYETISDAPDFEAQEIYCDKVLSLHLDWLLLFILQENKVSLNELTVILNDKQTIYEKMMGSYELNPEKWMKLQTEKSDLDISKNKLDLEWEYLLNKYQLQNQEINFDNFITIETLSQNLNETLPSLAATEALDQKGIYEQQLLAKEIELESSEDKQLVDFVQVKYNGPHTDAWEERLSIGLGFQLSNSGNKKIKLQELQLEQEELNRKLVRAQQEKQEKLIDRRNKLQSDLQAYFHFQKTIKEERSQLQTLSSRMAQKAGTSPLLLLDIEERHLLLQIKALNKKEALLKDYLRYVHQSDQMCPANFVNYLSP